MLVGVILADLQPLDIAALNPPLNVTLVKDWEGVIKLAAFLKSATVVSFDTETNIVDFFYHRRIRTIQVGNKDAQFVVDLWELVGRDKEELIRVQGDYGRHISDYPLLKFLVETLRLHLESNRVLKVGHNLSFDYGVSRWCLGLRPWHFYDTQLAEQVIYCGQVPFFAKNFWALDDLVGRYVGKRIDKSKQKSFDLETELTAEQIEYAALDTRLPIAVMTTQNKVLAKHRLCRAAQIEFDAIPPFEDMHQNGIFLDRAKWMTLVDANEVQHKLNIEALDKHFIPLVGIKSTPKHDLTALEKQWRDADDKVERARYRRDFQIARRELKEALDALPTYEGQAAINYGSDTQLLEVLREAGYGPKKLRNTNDQTLKKFRTDPLIAAIRDYRKTGKVRSTYGEGFLDQHIRPETGRVHSRFRQLGAETGRTSSTKPNVQNILKGADWRGCFVARPGFKILTIDFNGCELRILAELSGESVWLEAFKNGWDVHSVGAEILFTERWASATEPGCEYAEAHQKCSCKGHRKLRGRIKAVNFGLAYGMEARKLSEELEIPLEEAEELMAFYKGKFVIVTAYLEKSGRAAQQKFESRTMSGRRRIYNEPSYSRVHEIVAQEVKMGKLSPERGQKETGRRYHGILNGIIREGKNTPIQGTNADITKIAMGCGFDNDGKPFAWHLIEPVYQSKLVNMVHDELVTESPDDQAEACFAAVADCMTRAGAEFVKTIPMTTDGHIADRWVKD